MPPNEMIPLGFFAGLFIVSMVKDWEFSAVVFGLATLATGSSIAGVQLW
jgi:hypothetical protein